MIGPVLAMAKRAATTDVAWSACAAGLAFAAAAAAQPGAMRTATGVVFLDADRDSVRDDGERGIPGVRVSNGRDVVTTGSDGSYRLDVDEDDIIFVIKPRDHMTPVNDLGLPQFHYIHKPAGSPDGDFLFKGVEPTGPLPASVDFPLYERPERGRFRVLLFGDPQPYNQQQVAYYTRQIVNEIREADNHGAEFVIALGDLVGDDLELFEPYNDANAMLGLPIYNVYGNHDVNFKSPNDEHSDETFERVFGPATYAFQHGDVHFVVLDNVLYMGFDGYRSDGFPNTGNYTGHLRDDQLAFLESFVETVPRDELIVLAMHIPFHDVDTEKHTTPEHRRALEILSEHPNSFSLSAHTHRLWQRPLGEERGYRAPGGAIHWHINAGATCGSWWRGPLDERGLPLATMTDGTPNGYLIASFDGADYALRFKAAGEPATDQMRIRFPDVIAASDVSDTPINVNAFMAVGSDTVEARVVGGDGLVLTDWFTLRHVEGEPDPGYVALFEADQARGLSPKGMSLRDPRDCTHLFRGVLPSSLGEGTYIIETRFTDRFGQAHRGSRTVRVLDE
jgi:hypothetical protein